MCALSSLSLDNNAILYRDFPLTRQVMVKTATLFDSLALIGPKTSAPGTLFII
jgi:hypothetical protein